MWARVRLVALRDFKATVLTPAFFVATVGMPILLLLTGALGLWLTGQGDRDPLEGTVGLLASTPEVLEATRFELSAKRIEAERLATVEGVRARVGSAAGDMAGKVTPMGASLKVRVQPVSHRRLGKGVVAVARVDERILDPEAPLGRVELWVADSVNRDQIALLERRLGAAVVRVRSARAGISPERARVLLLRPATRTVRVDEAGVELPESAVERFARQFLVPAAFLLLMWGAAFAGGHQLLMSTLEEKSSRVVEVLLSAVSATELMAGKVLGQGAVGLLIVAVYGLVGELALVAFAATAMVEPTLFLWFFVFFFLAYFMVAAMMAAVGGAVDDIQEANLLLLPIMVLETLPLWLWLPISRAPNDALAIVCSFVPPISPFAMMLRLTSEESIPLWQVVLSALWGVACVAGMIWVAARIFRVGLLLRGKRPGPRELWRWIREA